MDPLNSLPTTNASVDSKTQQILSRYFGEPDHDDGMLSWTKLKIALAATVVMAALTNQFATSMVSLIPGVGGNKIAEFAVLCVIFFVIVYSVQFFV